MARQDVNFGFASTGADGLAKDFRKVGDNATLAAKGARLCADELRAEERAAKVASDALHKAERAAVLLDIAERELDDEIAKTNRKLLEQAGAADVAARRMGAVDRAADRAGKSFENLGKKGPGWLAPLLAAVPALATIGGVGVGAGVGLAGAFTAGAGALAAFGAVAKPVLADAKKAAAGAEAAQTAHAAAVAKVTGQYAYAMSVAKTKAQRDAAYAAEQKGFSAAGLTQTAALSKAYAGMSPQQIALSRQIGQMADAWDAVKKAQTPVISGALQPWLKTVTGLTKSLSPIIAAVAPVIGKIGAQFAILTGSSAFQTFVKFIAGTGSAAVAAGGNLLTGLLDAFVTLLPKFNPLIKEASHWVSGLGDSLAHWANSQKTADHITAFMAWFNTNGPAVGRLLVTAGQALANLAPGLTAGGLLEVKALTTFLGFVARLPKGIAGPITEVAGAALILSKIPGGGKVITFGVKLAGKVGTWLLSLIGIGGKAATIDIASAGMQAAGDTMLLASRNNLKAAGAMAGESAAAGGAGGAAGKAGGAGAAGGLAAAFAPAGIAAAGIFAGAFIRAMGDKLSPKGSFAGQLNQMFQGLSISSLHSFTFGGLEGWLTAKIGIPFGKVLNDVGAGARLWAADTTDNIHRKWSGLMSAIAIAFDIGKEHIRIWWDDIKILFLKGEDAIVGIMAKLPGPLGAPFKAAHRAIAGELGAIQADVASATGNIQADFDRLHGKTITLTEKGLGKFTIAGPAGMALHPGFAIGGRIGGHGGPRADNQLIAASTGEFVHQATAVSKYGIPAMEAVNAGRAVIGYAGGGAVSSYKGSVGGLGPWTTQADQVFTATMTNAMTTAMTAATKQAMKQAADPFAGITGVPSGAKISGSAQAAMNFAKSILWAYGWGQNQFPPLRNLWMGESGWNYRAYNASSGATGIPQSLPGSKMASAGADWRTNPATQIRWGLGYIKSVYGSPANAYSRWLGRSPHWYSGGGLIGDEIPGYATGGSVAQQGQTFLNAWRSRHAGPYALAIGPRTLNQQIPAMAAALGRARTLAGARGLSPGQHRFWAGAAASDARLLATLRKELTVERDWRGQLGLGELALDREIRAAGNIRSLAGPVRGWKAQLAAHKYTIGQIGGMIGLTAAQAAAAARKPPPGPVLPKITHTYGGDVANTIGTVLSAALGPFTGARAGGLVMDTGGTLSPGWQPVYNGTGRPETLVPARGGGGRLEIEWVGGNGSDDLERWIRKNVRIRGGGDVQRAYGSR